jgi:hypothetical protein
MSSADRPNVPDPIPPPSDPARGCLPVLPLGAEARRRLRGLAALLLGLARADLASMEVEHERGKNDRPDAEPQDG